MTAENDVCEVIVTGPDDGWIESFTTSLVESRVAACGQITRGVRSIYRWQGDVEKEPEARVALHTRAALFDQLVAITIELHPYDQPCIFAIPITHADPGYRAWILDSTDPPGPDERTTS